MKETLSLPCNMTLTQSYEAQRDLLTGMVYRRGNNGVAERSYSYDTLGRLTLRNTARQGKIVNDTFAHNTRSELVGATVNNKEYEYTYDNIGNRQQATEDNDVTVYDANALNQYTAISENGVATFVPQFDTDGNQTLIKTDTGIWSAIYNAENRPTDFYKIDESGSTTVKCTYDHLGRRATWLVTVNGNVTLHQRYIYRGYLQIACIDLTRSHHPALWYITWDATQPVATRPLAIQKDGTWYTYGWDLTKNICETFKNNGTIGSVYTYSTYGAVSHNGSIIQPLQWGAEYYDEEFALSYYNYRYYNQNDGRWLSRDILEEKEDNLLYTYCKNNAIQSSDYIGLQTSYENRPCMEVLSSNYLGKKYSSAYVYRTCDGNVYENHLRDPDKYKDSCALRVSRALNHSTHKIIKIKGIAKNRFISDSDGNINLLGANELMYYIESRFGKPDLKVYNGGWADKVKDKCAIVFYVNDKKNATHVGLLKDGKPYSDRYGSTFRKAHIWFVPCVCVYNDKCEYCKQKIEEEKRKQKRLEEFFKSLLELQSRV